MNNFDKISGSERMDSLQGGRLERALSTRPSLGYSLLVPPKQHMNKQSQGSFPRGEIQSVANLSKASAPKSLDFDDWTNYNRLLDRRCYQGLISLLDASQKEFLDIVDTLAHVKEPRQHCHGHGYGLEGGLSGVSLYPAESHRSFSGMGGMGREPSQMYLDTAGPVSANLQWGFRAAVMSSSANAGGVGLNARKSATAVRGSGGAAPGAATLQGAKSILKGQALLEGGESQAQLFRTVSPDRRGVQFSRPGSRDQSPSSGGLDDNAEEIDASIAKRRASVTEMASGRAFARRASEALPLHSQGSPPPKTPRDWQRVLKRMSTTKDTALEDVLGQEERELVSLKGRTGVDVVLAKRTPHRDRPPALEDFGRMLDRVNAKEKELVRTLKGVVPEQPGQGLSNKGGAGKKGKGAQKGGAAQGAKAALEAARMSSGSTLGAGVVLRPGPFGSSFPAVNLDQAMLEEQAKVTNAALSVLRLVQPNKAMKVIHEHHEAANRRVATHGLARTPSVLGPFDIKQLAQDGAARTRPTWDPITRIESPRRRLSPSGHRYNTAKEPKADAPLVVTASLDLEAIRAEEALLEASRPPTADGQGQGSRIGSPLLGSRSPSPTASPVARRRSPHKGGSPGRGSPPRGSGSPLRGGSPAGARTSAHVHPPSTAPPPTVRHSLDSAGGRGANSFENRWFVPSRMWGDAMSHKLSDKYREDRVRPEVRRLEADLAQARVQAKSSYFLGSVRAKATGRPWPPQAPSSPTGAAAAAAAQAPQEEHSQPHKKAAGHDPHHPPRTSRVGASAPGTAASSHRGPTPASLASSRPASTTPSNPGLGISVPARGASGRALVVSSTGEHSARGTPASVAAAKAAAASRMHMTSPGAGPATSSPG